MLEGHILFAVLKIVKLEMALGEGAAAAVLAAEAYGRTFQHKAAESKRFGVRPIDGRAVKDFLTLVEEAAELGMKMEVLRERRDAADNALGHGVVDVGKGMDEADLGRVDGAQFLHHDLFRTT